jgi:hypothetical protein
VCTLLLARATHSLLCHTAATRSNNVVVAQYIMVLNTQNFVDSCCFYLRRQLLHLRVHIVAGIVEFDNDQELLTDCCHCCFFWSCTVPCSCDLLLWIVFSTKKRLYVHSNEWRYCIRRARPNLVFIASSPKKPWETLCLSLTH